MIYRLSFLFLSIFFPTATIAQQLGQVSQYMMNYYLINPAVAGTEDYLDIRSGYRYQWLGLDGAPQNYYISAHQPLTKVHALHNKQLYHKKNKPYHAVGGALSGQTLGALGTYNANLGYSYHLPLSYKWNIAAGATAGMGRHILNQQKADFGDDVTDIAANSFQSWQPTMAFGLWLHNADFFGGISLNQLFQTRFGEAAQLHRHYYITAGYQIKVDQELSIIPSILLKAIPNIAQQVDVNLKVKYMQLCWAGISYRHQDAVVFLVGCTAKYRYDIGYSYDLTTSNLRRYSSGTHELMVGIKLNTGTHVYSPSDFW